MVDQKLINYIKTNLSKGVPLEQIKQSLRKSGWSDYDIKGAINLAIQRRTFPAVPTPPLYKGPIKKPTKPVKWIVLILIAFIIIGGIFTFFIFRPEEEPTESEKPSEPADCGTNLDCLITASQNCDLAKVAHTTTIDLFGIEQTTTSHFELKGIELNKCIFYIRTENIDIQFSDELIQQMLDGGATQEEITQQEQESNRMVDELEGRDGTCKFNTNDLTAMLNRWKEGNFEGSASCSFVDGSWECTYTGDWVVAEECEGDYFSQQI